MTGRSRAATGQCPQRHAPAEALVKDSTKRFRGNAGYAPTGVVPIPGRRSVRGMRVRSWRPKSCRRRRLKVDIVAGCQMRSLLILGSRLYTTYLTVTAMIWLPI